MVGRSGRGPGAIEVFPGEALRIEVVLLAFRTHLISRLGEAAWGPPELPPRPLRIIDVLDRPPGITVLLRRVAVRRSGHEADRRLARGSKAIERGRLGIVDMPTEMNMGVRIHRAVQRARAVLRHPLLRMVGENEHQCFSHRLANRLREGAGGENEVAKESVRGPPHE